MAISENYATYRRDRPNAVNVVGVALLIHKDIPHQKINSPPGNTIETIGIKLISGTHIDTVRRCQTPNVPRQSWTRAKSEPTNQSRRTAGRKCWNAIGRPTKVDDRAPVRSPGPINIAALWQWLTRRRNKHTVLGVALSHTKSTAFQFNPSLPQ
jgi:hypothetical protein